MTRRGRVPRGGSSKLPARRPSLRRWLIDQGRATAAKIRTHARARSTLAEIPPALRAPRPRSGGRLADGVRARPDEDAFRGGLGKLRAPLDVSSRLGDGLNRQRALWQPELAAPALDPRRRKFCERFGGTRSKELRGQASRCCAGRAEDGVHAANRYAPHEPLLSLSLKPPTRLLRDHHRDGR